MGDAPERPAIPDLEWFAGDMGAFASRVLTEGERRAVENYLSALHGIRADLAAPDDTVSREAVMQLLIKHGDDANSVLGAAICALPPATPTERNEDAKTLP